MNKLHLQTLRYHFIIFILFLSYGTSAQVPTVKFGANTLSPEMYDALILYDSSTNNPTQWEWNIYDSTLSPPADLSSGDIFFNANTNRYSKNPEIMLTRYGHYTVTLRCKNASGWSTLLVKKNYIRFQPSNYYYLGYTIDYLTELDYGSIYDDGGPFRNYHNNIGNNGESYLLIQPCKAKKIILSMSQLKFSDNQDVLYVYDDKRANSSKLLAAWTRGNTANKTVTALSGTMYIVFKSNGTGVDSGFAGSYTCELDTAASGASVDFDSDSILYNGVPVFINDKTTGFPGIPKTTWTIDGYETKAVSKLGLNARFWSDGYHQVCLQYTGCNEQQSKCKKIKIATPIDRTTLNFKAVPKTLHSDTIYLKPIANKADHFVWTISPTSYILLNPPSYPSKYSPGKITYNDNPGDTFSSPHIWFLDSTCYTITLTGFNSLDSATTSNTLTKTNYVCAQDFRKKYGLFGTVFLDLNSNCSLDPSESLLKDIPVKLYDSTNNFIDLTYTEYNGEFRFEKTKGQYKMVLDISRHPLTTSCKTGLDTVVQISPANLFGGVSFATQCGSSDVGIQSIHTVGRAFPGRTHNVVVKAGYTNKGIIQNCSTFYDTGTLKITVIGKLKYLGIPAGYPTPVSISGNTAIFKLKDMIQSSHDNISLSFKTDTSAKSGDTITVLTELHLSNKGKDTTNDKLKFIYTVSNSYDPNLKETFPAKVYNAFNNWFYYTIQFQNTGNAPAYNIRLEDTLDNRLDLETLEVTDRSHETRIALKKNVLNFYFDDIMLPDSFSDSEGSHGFVQYRIKPKTALSIGTKIYNTAYIYFDYNSAVVTNTTMNECVKNSTNGIHSLQDQFFTIFPNPAQGVFNIRMKLPAGNASAAVYNHMGVLVKTLMTGDTNTIDLSAFPDGMYLLRLDYNGDHYYAKLIKE